MFRVAKPVVEIVKYTQDTFQSQIFKEHRTTITKTLEWSFFYFLCYMGYGYGWVLFLASIYHMKYQGQQYNNKNMTSKYDRHSFNNLSCLASWISFPDFDRVNWINQILYQLWPNVNSFATTFVKTIIEPKIQNTLEMLQIKQLAGFEIERVELGSIPARVEGVKVYDQKYILGSKSEEIILDCDFVYEGDAKITFSIQGILAEITTIKFRGMARVQLKPLINRIPFIGGFELYFLDKPLLDYTLGGIGNLADLPGVSNIVRNVVDGIICSKFVWPNRLKLHLPLETPIKPPIPAGLLTVTLREAKNLMKADKYFGGSGNSDPYAIICLGERKVSFRDNYVPKTVNPIWNYSATFAVEQPDRHIIHIGVYDFDKASADDFLGKAMLPLVDIIQNKTFDNWISLSDIDHGEIHVNCDWKTAKPGGDPLRQNLKDLYLVSVFVNECQELTGGKGDLSSLYPKCEIKLNSSSTKEEFTTQSKNKTENPVFEQGYIFTSEQPQYDTLIFNVINAKDSDMSFGNVTIPISLLMASPNQEYINKILPLEGGSPSAKMSVSLKLYFVE